MQTVKIPWGAWYKESLFDISFPVSWDVNIYQINDSAPLDQVEIAAAVKNAIGSQSLSEVSRKSKNAVIAIEDITRPSEMEFVLRAILNELFASGLKKENISFVICNGAHAPMTREDMVKKYGETIVSEYLIQNHNPYDNLIDTGLTVGKTPLRINRFFAQADLKICVGTIMPHSFAGFSSGAKLVLPGLSGIEALERTHKFVMMGLRGGVNNVENNAFRKDMEEVVAQVGIDFFVGIVPNSCRKVAGVFSGDLVKAHRAGVDFCREIYKTKVKPADILILNAYPKDTELIQADAAFTPLKTTPKSLVKDGGIIVVTSSCSNGFGYHSLFGPGMRLYRKPIKRRFLNDVRLMVFAPNVNRQEFNRIFWDGYSHLTSWAEVVQIMQNEFNERASVAILPTAPLQLLEVS